MTSNTSFANFTKLSFEIPEKLNQSEKFLTSLSQQLIVNVFLSMNVVGNSVALFLCYLYLKNFKQHSLILLDGYVTIFKIFAEYIGATVCVCYGILEMDQHYLLLGTVGIFLGLCMKALLLYHQVLSQNRCTRFAAQSVGAIYLVYMFLCCSGFHDVTLELGAQSCATRILTCVVPLVALSDAFWTDGVVYLSICTDVLAFSVLFWHCSHLSLKYFVFLPSVIGMLFTFIHYVLEVIEKAATKEIETDIHK